MWWFLIHSPKPHHSACYRPLSALWSTWYKSGLVSWLYTQDSFGIQWIISKMLVHFKLMRKTKCLQAWVPDEAGISEMGNTSLEGQTSALWVVWWYRCPYYLTITHKINDLLLSTFLYLLRQLCLAQEGTGDLSLRFCFWPSLGIFSKTRDNLF